jgi:NhaP-type Na+/H+ or K+/H+ antiporter
MAVIIISLAVVGYALVSKRLATTPVTGPMLFLVLGVAIGPSAFRILQGTEDRATIETVLEAALALVLFTDSVAISAGNWRAKGRLPLRLLVIGMPLTIALGWIVARALIPGIEPWEAALLAIALAPTDAALGQAVVANPRAPSLVRQALNIESGLNDGLALPFFLLALAAGAHADGVAGPGAVEVFVRAIGLAALAGGITGWLGARALAAARRHGWIGRAWTQIAVLALVVIAFAWADAMGGSGFIAAWVAGVAFGRTMGDRMPDAPVLAEDLGALLAAVAFLGFGAFLLGPSLAQLSWQVVAYAVVSLTAIRMVPVAMSLAGTGLSRPTVLYAGWFGPRGLASIVFGLLLAEEALPNSGPVLDAIFVTVGLSALVHGASAVGGVGRYAAWYERAVRADPNLPEAEDVGGSTVRRRLLTPGATDDT